MTLGVRYARLRAAVAARPKLWLAITLGFPVIYHLGMLAALVIRFQALPNYTVFYDWFGNVAEIVRSTPAVADMAPIIGEEWLLEIGRMNYDYGNGISEWSLSVLPTKIVLITVLAAAMAAIVCLILHRRNQCGAAQLGGSSAAGVFGTSFVGLTNITLSWVVCCATPNWVVGLAILGVGTSTSLWFEQFGPYIEWSGIVLLLVAIYGLTGDKKTPPTPASDDSISHNVAGATS